MKRFIDVGTGVIDNDYKGNVGIVLFNHSDEDFNIQVEDRIAQLTLEKIKTPVVQKVRLLSATARGKEEFGSMKFQSTVQ